MCGGGFASGEERKGVGWGGVSVTMGGASG